MCDPNFAGERRKKMVILFYWTQPNNLVLKTSPITVGLKSNKNLNKKSNLNSHIYLSSVDIPFCNY